MPFPVSVARLPTAFVLIPDACPFRSMREILSREVSLLQGAVEMKGSGVRQTVWGGW